MLVPLTTPRSTAWPLLWSASLNEFEREGQYKIGVRQCVHGFLGKIIAVPCIINHRHGDRLAIVGDSPTSTYYYAVSHEHPSRSQV